MGYLDGLTDSSFKTDDEGNTVFYPFGLCGKGRILPDKDSKNDLRMFLKRYYQVSLTSMLVALLTLGLFWSLLIATCYLVPFYYVILNKVRNFPVSEMTLNISDSMKNSAQSHNRFTLCVLLIVCILFVLASVLIIIINPQFWLLSVSGIVFFGLSGQIFCKMIRFKDK